VPPSDPLLPTVASAGPLPATRAAEPAPAVPATASAPAPNPTPGAPTGPADAPPGGGDPDRVLTVPNLLTLGRLLCLPVFLWLLFGRGDRAWAAILLAVLGATDWCDGYIARRFHQESNLGRLFDPSVDRLLFLVGVGGIVVDAVTSPEVYAPARWALFGLCALVLVREVTVALITVTITVLGARPVRVTWFGKAGTFLLMFAFPWFLGGRSTLSTAPIFDKLAWLVAVPGVLISYYAAFTYLPHWRENLREARGRRAAQERPTGP
jgi:cardiolipin synthase